MKKKVNGHIVVQNKNSLYIHDEKSKVSDEVTEKAADIVPSFDIGTLDVSHTADLTVDHTEERYLFGELTGIKLDQYNVYDKHGKLDVVASNINMQKNLLALSTQNYIESARTEQLGWNDSVRGEIADKIGRNFNPTGDIAIHDALESVDPRDQTKFMLMSRVAQDVYRRSYFTQDSCVPRGGKECGTAGDRQPAGADL